MKLNIRPPKLIGLLAVIVLLALTSVTSVWAQERFSTLTGTVKDPSGSVVPDAKVSAENVNTKRVLETKTAGNGEFRIMNAEAGRYTVRFEKVGFATTRVDDVLLVVGKATSVNPSIQVGTAAESVTVVENAGLIDFSTTKIANNISAEDFDRLPKGRSFQSLALTSASVNSGEVEGGFQVNGASGGENQFNIDGVSTTSLINGKSRQNALFEILQEVQVKTSGLDAEYGGAMGGVISAVTKSGGNAFHGEGHYYFSGNAIGAGPVKRLVLNQSTEKDVSYFQDGKFKDNNHEIGGSVGGPILKNRMYFFTLFSPRFRSRSNDYLFSNGTQPGTIDQDQTYHAWFNKLSYDVHPKLRTNFTYLWTPTRSTGNLLGYAGYGNNFSTQTLAGAAPNKTIGWSQPQTSYTGQVDWTPSATALITFRGGRFWDDYKSTGISPVGSVTYGNSATALPFAIPDALKQASGYSNTPRVTNTAFDLATRTYFQVDGNKIVNAWGQHTFKAGWGLSKTVNKVQDIYPGGGFVRVFWNATEPLGIGGRGTYGWYEVNDRGTRGSTGGRMQNIYFQDTWKITRRVTASLGLRLENEHVPSFRRDIRDDAFAFGFGEKIAPRLGVTWDILGNGKAKMYASYSKNYDWIKYELSRGTFGGDTWCIYYRSLDTLDIFNNLGNSKPGRQLWNNSPTNTCRDRRVPSFNDLDPNLKPFSSALYTGGVEYEVMTNSVLRFGYVHNQVLHAIEDLGVLKDGNEVYIYGNPGEGLATNVSSTTGLTKLFAYPKPDRRYDALEVQFKRRFSKGYFLDASYVLSRLYGNYAGTANSDEITLPSTNLGSATAQQSGGSVARQAGSANRPWDLDEILFDSRGHLDVVGRLNTDRPHVFKVYGAKDVKWNGSNSTMVGLFFYGGSGTPVSTLVNTTNQVPVFVNGRGDLGRTPVLTQTDLNISHTFKISESKRISFEMNMLNLFNQKTSRQTFNYVNRGAGSPEPSSAINLSGTDLFKGYNYNALIAATADAKGTRGALDPRFGKQDLFNPGFAGRFGIKFIF